MSLTFLSPLSILVLFACALPLAAFAKTRATGRRTRLAVGLPEPPRRWYLVPLVALLLAAVLIGLAAAQPVVEFDRTSRVRTDAEVVIAIDTTRSMLARPNPRARARIVRAKEAALEIREALPSVPVGLASLTDRTLPHLFPSADEESFRATLVRSIGVDRPPPQGGFLSRATRLESLSAVATQGFFSPSARHRVLVVLTDGESLPSTQAHLTAAFARPPGVETVFLHVWAPDEHVYAGRLPESGYRPDPTARATLDRFASEVGGATFAEGQLSTVKSTVSKLVGRGPTVVRGDRRDHVALAPFLAGAAFFPLVLLLWRRDR